MADPRTRLFSGMTAFWAVWIGQLVSILGSSMTQFALTIWAYEKTGSATALALMGLFYIVPLLVMTPVAGLVVDRHDRKRLIIISDAAAVVVTVTYLILYRAGMLEIWHLYAGASINGVTHIFQSSSIRAALPLMIPKAQYVRASSLRMVLGPGAHILAPVLAGAILGLASSAGGDGVWIIFLIDIVSFSAAIGAILLVAIPNAPRTGESQKSEEGSYLARAMYGFRYIADRPSLLWYQMTFTLGNLLFNIAYGVLLAPMILSRTDHNTWLFGSIEMTAAIGAVVGGVLMSAWGGFRRRIYGVLSGWVLLGIGVVVVGLGRMEPGWMIGLWLMGVFVTGAAPALIDSSSAAIWMSKVDPGVQGRVNAAQLLIAYAAMPLAALLGGPLADFVMEPAMQEGGALAGLFGPLVGTGPGAGMSLMMVLSGAVDAALGLLVFLIPLIRDVELRIPDHQGAETPTPAGAPEGVEVTEPAPA